MEGTIVNVMAIIIGGFIGLLFRKGIKENIKTTVVQGISLGVIIIGVQMALQVENMLVVIISLVLGGILGEIIKIEEKLYAGGKWLENRLGESHGDVAKGFVTTSLIFCVGAMAIVGAIENGLTGNPNTLYAKSILDGTIAMFFASTMGIGVLFSAVPVLLYQGTITIFASSAKDFLTPEIINQITATGGILILGIGINLLTDKNIKIGNLLPSVLIVVLITIALGMF